MCAQNRVAFILGSIYDAMMFCLKLPCFSSVPFAHMVTKCIGPKRSRIFYPMQTGSELGQW